MLVINSIEKSRLQADSWNYSGNGVAWKAQFVLFLGFALLAGGLAGGVTVMVLKYLIQGYPMPTLYFGIANVVANGLVMIRYFSLFPLSRLNVVGLTWDVVRLCCGCRRISRTTTRTTLLYNCCHCFIVSWRCIMYMLATVNHNF